MTDAVPSIMRAHQVIVAGDDRHRDGRMRYHWGPLLRNGGERRLDVAVTRARQRLTLVSSFSSRDVDPDRVTSAGARLLCDYRPGQRRRPPARAGAGHRRPGPGQPAASAPARLRNHCNI
jgi:hypothetical protein